MKTVFKGILFVLAGVFVILLSLQSLSTSEVIDQQLSVATLIATPESQIKIQTPVDINDLPFQDNMDVYHDDDPSEVVTMYVTVRKGNASDNTDFTWQEVNSFSKWYYTNMEIVEVGKAEAILQIGDENGPLPGELGYGEVIPNATIQIRGASTSRMPQKSFKIELRDRAGDWRGQTTIALNKHIWDPSRVRNKLSFDLMKEISHIVSLRTQFVHLYIKDETSDPPSEEFVDFGLFTQIEQPNSRFLRNHLLDSDGQLYKTTFFEFYRYADQIRRADDPLYDEDAFSTILEVKGNRDHSKLIQMLEDVNNYNIPIELTLEKYFDLDNYFTWLGFNILVGNLDTQSQNFYLYSPKNSETWYFIPWDYDAAFFRLQPDRMPYQYWEFGIANYWGVVLHNRVFKIEKYRLQLDEKINELMAFLTPERIKSMLLTYKEVTEPYLFRMPDLYYLPATEETYELDYNAIPAEIQNNYELYLLSLQSPMPFYLGTPKIFYGDLIFTWGESYDFDAQNIRYHFYLSRNWEFTEIVHEETVSNLTEIRMPIPEPGTYFWRIIATNEDSKIQYPFDTYRDAEGIPHDGMKYLYITSDGQILEEEQSTEE